MGSIVSVKAAASAGKVTQNIIETRLSREESGSDKRLTDDPAVVEPVVSLRLLAA